MRPSWDHSWGVVSDGHVVCRSGGDSQGVARILPAKRLTSHHDERLANLTQQVNDLLAQHADHEDGQRNLALIRTPDGIMLAWTRNEHDRGWDSADASSRGELISADSDDDAVRDALGLS